MLPKKLKRKIAVDKQVPKDVDVKDKQEEVEEDEDYESDKVNLSFFRHVNFYYYRTCGFIYILNFVNFKGSFGGN